MLHLRTATRSFHALRRVLPQQLCSRQRFCSSEAAELLSSPRETMEYDVAIVGAGPAGLSAAIKLRQLAAQHDTELSVCVIEKGHEVGAHILSGNVLEPRALNELLPDWKERDAPLKTLAKSDEFLFLTKSGSVPLPVPPMLHNDGNYICSLGQVCRWLGEQAEELGVDVFPATAASEVVYTDSGAVKGIATRDMGVGKDGQPKDTFMRGMELHAKQTLFAEGARGSLSEDIQAKFNLRDGACPQVYGLGLKEVWRVDPDKHRPGHIQHSVGWPLPQDVYGGSFLYHMEPDLVLVGFVVGLDYKNPYLNPYLEFQRFKHHPAVARHIEGGECVQYGARVINEGGFQSIPKLTFPGGALLGCSAGFVNVPKIKGTHTAMKSGIVAAEAIFDTVRSEDVTTDSGVEVSAYQQGMENSWVWPELKSVRNYHPSFSKGLFGGMAYSGLSAFILRGKEPWTFKHTTPDVDTTEPASKHTPIEYPKPDNKLSFDILTNVARTGTNHEGDQVPHLRIKPGMEDVPSQVSYAKYAGPESRFCPARVYEYPEGDEVVINFQNCIHCKTCDIKTPRNYIKWTVPEGGGGPAYETM